MINTPQRRVLTLERVFTEIAHTRMLGVPVQNRAVYIQAFGFLPEPDDKDMLLGVLVTPWFMNLVRLPTRAPSPGDKLLAVGKKVRRMVGHESFEFIGACEPGIGTFEVCSLFSPMFEFADHAAAADTANEILNLLRTPVKPGAITPQPLPNRRGFLFGRGTEPARAQA
ncbi:[NiFe]-hydrogenase assembly chaperone HybE [Rhodoferax sp.]|uniref:[NiFe]-hydrogenase assembly chaperone HybE n=1 Tax=Rhodoferax sp. TaxID=50421 RepID=UPI002716C9C3|nr:[NiFe]-hydrogenase assembly chaperone HybE [Rhodoferax sp.]MDO8321089.1 [NiFe]-hydrogenase assembly chaperone HybE [Rhodoferax sp.]